MMKAKRLTLSFVGMIALFVSVTSMVYAAFFVTYDPDEAARADVSVTFDPDNDFIDENDVNSMAQYVNQYYSHDELWNMAQEKGGPLDIAILGVRGSSDYDPGYDDCYYDCDEMIPDVPISEFIAWQKSMCRDIPGTEYRVYKPDQAQVWFARLRPNVVLINQPNLYQIRVTEIYDEYVKTECLWEEVWSDGVRSSEWRPDEDRLVEKDKYLINSPVSYDDVRIEGSRGRIEWPNNDVSRFRDKGEFIAIWSEAGYGRGLTGKVTVHPDVQKTVRISDINVLSSAATQLIPQRSTDGGSINLREEEKLWPEDFVIVNPDTFADVGLDNIKIIYPDDLAGNSSKEFIIVAPEEFADVYTKDVVDYFVAPSESTSYCFVLEGTDYCEFILY